MKASDGPAGGRGGRARLRLGMLLVVLLAVAAFGGVAGNRFINYDDELYLTENRWVGGGLTPKGVAWSFTTLRGSNWHPLTWLSHMLDVELWGMNPAGHHLSGLAIHAASAAILLSLLYSATGNGWASLLAAAVFAVHPLQAESVAWASERKNLLCAFFGFLALGAYLDCRGKPVWWRWALTAAFFILGLMSKPALVVFPLLLLLLDYWPLGRFVGGPGGRRARPAILAAVVEKIPLFALAAASAVVTFLAQQAGGSVSSLERLPLGLRMVNAAGACLKYAAAAVWPAKLSVLYMLTGRRPPWWQGPAVLLLLAAATWLFASHRWRPYLVMGWLWFLVLLVPVLGFVQVGMQSRADRYMYLPLVGLGVMAAWGARDLPRRRRPWAAAAAALFLAFLVFAARRQTSYWRDGVTLFRHAAGVSDNYLVRNNLGAALAKEGKYRAAVPEYRAALRFYPGFADARNNLAASLLELGELDEAEVEVREALSLKPGLARAHYNLGRILARRGRDGEALRQYLEAVGIDPEFSEARNNLGMLLAREGRIVEAAAHFEKAVELKPDNEKARYNWGLALTVLGRSEEAERQLREAVRLDPRDVDALNNLGVVLAERGRTREAAGFFSAALRLKPDYGEARMNLIRLGRRPEE